MKQKTNKAFAKRFKLTATGKVKFKRSGMRHILFFRSRKNKLPLKKGGYLSDADVARVEKALPYGSTR